MEDKVISHKLLYGLYIFVFNLYGIFFLIFFAILIAPNIFLLFFIFIIFGLQHIYPLLLFPLLTIIGIVIGYFIENRHLDRKQFLKMLIIPGIIVFIFVIIYFLIEWMIPFVIEIYSQDQENFDWVFWNG